MTQKHHYTVGMDDYGDVYDIVIRDNDTIIAVLCSGEGPAMHLVRAGNCFDDVLEALKNVWAVCDANAYEVPMGYRNQVFAAIAKAEGREATHSRPFLLPSSEA